MKQVRKAVIPAAGWGTRCLPASKAVPKEMLTIVDKPAIQYTVEEAVDAGFTELLIIVSRNKSNIADHFQRNAELEDFLTARGKEALLEKIQLPEINIKISFWLQEDQKGLGHAVYCAREFVGNEPFAVLLPDDLIVARKPCISQMLDVYYQHQGTVIAVTEVKPDVVGNYGIIKPKGIGTNVFGVTDMIEKPKLIDAPSNLAIVGRYIIQPEIFSCLEKVGPGAGGEIQLTDALRMMVAGGRVFAYKFQGTRYDVGDIGGLIKANIHLALNHPDFGEEIEKDLLYRKNTKVGRPFLR